jgi:hypothetical protein
MNFSNFHKLIYKMDNTFTNKIEVILLEKDNWKVDTYKIEYKLKILG